MRKFRNLIVFLIFSLIAAGMVSCGEDTTPSGTDPPETDPPGDDPYTSITLAVDKDEIPSDGTMTATFTVTANDGTDLTGEATLKMNGKSYEGKTFEGSVDGDYVFVASYEDLKSNEVTVKVFTHEIPVGTLTLIPSSQSMVADNKTSVSFRVEFDGEDVTSESRVGSETYGLYIDPDDEGNIVWTSRESGKQKFFGYYNGLRSNIEIIEASPLADQSYFYKRAAFFKFTSWTCGPCYMYISYLDLAYESYPDRIVEVAIHGNLHANNPDPYTPSDYNNLRSNLCYGNTSSFPYTNLDMWEKFSYAGATNNTNIVENFSKPVESHPATTGFNVQSSVSGNQATVTVTVKSYLFDEYGLGVILMEDGLENTQSGATGMILHDKVYRSIATKVLGDPLGKLEVGDTATRTYNFDLTGYNPDKCKLMIYSTYKRANGKTVVDNATYASINGSLDYREE